MTVSEIKVFSWTKCVLYEYLMTPRTCISLFCYATITHRPSNTQATAFFLSFRALGWRCLTTSRICTRIHCRATQTYSFKAISHSHETLGNICLISISSTNERHATTDFNSVRVLLNADSKIPVFVCKYDINELKSELCVGLIVCSLSVSYACCDGRHITSSWRWSPCFWTVNNHCSFPHDCGQI